MHRRALALLATATLGAATSLAGQAPEPEDTLASYHRALELVQNAMEALGGLESLQGAGGIALTGAGSVDLAARLQGARSDEADPVPARESLAVDLAADRVGYESRSKVNPDAEEWLRTIHDGGQSLIVLPANGQAFWVPGDTDQRRRTERMVPHLLLRDALEHRQSLRNLGRFGNEEAVAFTLDSGETVTLLFDPDSGLLRGLEYLLDLPVRGDSLVRWRLDDWREVEGLGPYPGGYRIFVGDRLFKTMTYESVAVGVAGATVFEEPPGITFPPRPAPPEQDEGAVAAASADDVPDVRTLAEGVHLALNVRGGFHVLFVELDDGLLVVDAPAGYHELQVVPAMDWAGDVTSSSVGRRLLRAVRATVPEKPVRWLVLTHHHGDHAGGLRPFLDLGVEVVTAEATAPVVEQAARATFTLAPDELSGRDLEPRIAVVEGERVIGSGERRVRVLDVGPNPHVEGMLVVHLPEAGILYQSDLFMPSGGAFPDQARVPVMRWFVDWLDASGLEPEMILAIHGSGRVTDEQLETIRSLE